MNEDRRMERKNRNMLESFQTVLIEKKKNLHHQTELTNNVESHYP